MEKCSGKDCPYGAKFAPCICVPATGWPMDTHEHLQAIMSLPLCESCFSAMTVENFLGMDEKILVNGKNLIRETFKALTTGKMPPDFDRAYLKRVNINSVEYQQIKAATRDQASKDGKTVH